MGELRSGYGVQGAGVLPVKCWTHVQPLAPHCAAVMGYAVLGTFILLNVRLYTKTKLRTHIKNKKEV